MRRTRLDRIMPGIGRFTHRCPSAEELKKWDALLTKLWDTGRLELLRQLKAGSITFRELLDMERRDQLHYATDNIVLARSLWEAVGLAADGTPTGTGWLAGAARAEASRIRYGTAWRTLQRTGVLGPQAQIRDLSTMDWASLRRLTLAHLGPTGWNHIRRAVSAFLTAQLGGKLKGKYHHFRLAIMASFESEEEPERTPDLTVERFWEVLRHVPEPFRPSYVAMAAGGLGPGEYLRAEAHHLMPLTRGLRVLGTKKAARARTWCTSGRERGSGCAGPSRAPWATTASWTPGSGPVGLLASGMTASMTYGIAPPNGRRMKG